MAVVWRIRWIWIWIWVVAAVVASACQLLFSQSQSVILEELVFELEPFELGPGPGHVAKTKAIYLRPSLHPHLRPHRRPHVRVHPLYANVHARP